MSATLRSAPLCFWLAASAAAAAPQLVLVNADVYTADPARPRAQALAIENGRIRAVGDNAEIRALAGPATRVIDAGGRLVTPGLIEAHVHVGWNLPSPPLSLPGLPLPGPTPEQVLSAVEAAAKTREDWISAWIGPRVARDQRNWREALDAVAPRTPVLLRGFWGHTTIVNSAALRKLGIAEDVPDPIGGWWGRDANGRLDGRAHQSAEDIEQRALPPEPVRLAEQFRWAGERYARWGVTSIHQMNSGSPLGVTLEGLRLAKPKQKWIVYAWAGAVAHIDDAWKTIDAAASAVPPNVRVEGPKWVLDGTPIEMNALRRDPYPNLSCWRGRSNHTDEQLRQILHRALGSPRQPALHVVGDAQTERLLTLMQELAPPETWKGKRVRIEHGDGIRPDTLERVARLGLVVVQNPTHFPAPSPIRRTSQSMLASLVRGGVALALGSDGGPDEMNPFLNIMLASTYAAAPEEALSREQALLAYTSGAAHAERAERQKGRLMPGLAADLAVLSQNIFQVPVQALAATRSLLTLIDGVVVYEAPELTITR